MPLQVCNKYNQNIPVEHSISLNHYSSDIIYKINDVAYQKCNSFVLTFLVNFGNIRNKALLFNESFRTFVLLLSLSSFCSHGDCKEPKNLISGYNVVLMLPYDLNCFKLVVTTVTISFLEILSCGANLTLLSIMDFCRPTLS